jgi:hypothetical protein
MPKESKKIVTIMILDEAIKEPGASGAFDYFAEKTE